jgi:hypothetical protein
MHDSSLIITLAERTEDLCALIRRCWSNTPDDRPEFAEIITALQGVLSKYLSPDKSSMVSEPSDMIRSADSVPGLQVPASTKRWQQKFQNNFVGEAHDIITMLYRPEQMEVWLGYSDNQIKIWDMKVS